MWAKREPSTMTRVRISNVDILRGIAKDRNVSMPDALAQIIEEWSSMKNHECESMCDRCVSMADEFHSRGHVWDEY